MRANEVAEALHDTLKARGVVIEVPADGACSLHLNIPFRDDPVEGNGIAIAEALLAKIGAVSSIQFGHLPLPEGASSALHEEAGPVIVRRVRSYEAADDAEVIRWDITFNVR